MNTNNNMDDTSEKQLTEHSAEPNDAKDKKTENHFFHFDLTDNMQHADEKLYFSPEGEIFHRLGEGASFNAADFKELVVIVGVGCGLMCGVKEDENDMVICRFSMAKLKSAGEFCKVVNYYIKNKVFTPPEKTEVSVCPKCNRPLIEGLDSCVFCFSRTGLIKKTFKFADNLMKPLGLSQLFFTLSSLLFVLGPIFQTRIMDEHLLSGNGTFKGILLLASAIFVSRTAGDLIFIITARFYNRAGVNLVKHFREATFEKLQHLSISSLSKRTPGDLIRRVMEDTEVIKDFLTEGGRWAISHATMFVIIMVILLITNPLLTLLVFAPVPIIAFVFYKFRISIMTRYDRQWKKNSKARSILHDIIKGIRTVKSFGKEEDEIKKYDKASYEYAKVSSDNEVFWSYFMQAVSFAMGLGQFIVLIVGGYSIINGTMTLGKLTQFVSYLGYIYGPLQWLVSFPRWLGETLTSMVKVFEILEEKPEIRSVDNPRNISIAGDIIFNNVSFGYKSYEPVLKDINLEIKQGEMIGIVGRSGVGKSTLMNLMMRLYDPNQGSITIDGVDIRDIDPEHIHKNIGVVFQQTFLFAGEIYDNIAYGKNGAGIEEVIAAAKAAGAHDFIMNTDDGYSTLLGESGHSISGGERQRVSIARAIIKNPDILILDEATSSLDVETESVIQDSLDKITKGRTTIAIAHRLSTLRKADRLVVLDKGTIAEVGSHMELLRQKGIYYDLVMAQRKTGNLQKDKPEALQEAAAT